MNNEPGATREYPDGKLCDDDEGELQVMVCTHDGLVIVGFGKPVRWLGLTPVVAEQLGSSLIAHAASLRNSEKA